MRIYWRALSSLKCRLNFYSILFCSCRDPFDCPWLNTLDFIIYVAAFFPLNNRRAFAVFVVYHSSVWFCFSLLGPRPGTSRNALNASHALNTIFMYEIKIHPTMFRTMSH